MQDTIEGYVDHIVFRNDDNGYTVFVIRDIRYKGTDFQPHIYTDVEVNNYFFAV